MAAAEVARPIRRIASRQRSRGSRRTATSLLACDLATRNYSNVIARNFKLEQRAVYEELKANLVPGFILQPTGVYAALRAQEAGCAYLRSRRRQVDARSARPV